MFPDRQEAGRLLLEELRASDDEKSLVLALPRGGVLVAAEIAAGLGAELDVLIVRKLGAPGQPELAIGAIVDGSRPHAIFNDRLLGALHVTQDYIEHEIHAQTAEIQRRQETYRGGRANPVIQARRVIVVDDGIATGATVRAALQALRRQKPARLILAVPVAPREAISNLSAEADEIVCLETPDDFQAVGQFYGDFHAVEDDEVIDALQEAWTRDQD